MDQVQKTLDQAHDQLVIECPQSRKGGWIVIVPLVLQMGPVAWALQAVTPSGTSFRAWLVSNAIAVAAWPALYFFLSLLLNRTRVVAKRWAIRAYPHPLPSRKAYSTDMLAVSGFRSDRVSDSIRPNNRVLGVENSGRMAKVAEFLPTEEMAADVADQLNQFYKLTPLRVIGYDDVSEAEAKAGTAIFPEITGLKLEESKDGVNISYRSPIKQGNDILVGAICAISVIFGLIVQGQGYLIVFMMLILAFIGLGGAYDTITGDRITLTWRKVPISIAGGGQASVTEILRFVGREYVVASRGGASTYFGVYVLTKSGKRLTLQMMGDLGQAKAVAWRLNQFYGLGNGN